MLTNRYSAPERGHSWRGLRIFFLACLLCPGAGAPESVPREQIVADFDYLWTALRDRYAYFDKKATDWNKVREVYRPLLGDVRSRRDFVSLLERCLAELYDDHLSLNTNLPTSPRLVPTGLDVWAEWRSGRAMITQLRRGFSAEQAGLEPGMEIVAVNGAPIEDAVARRLPKSLKTVTAGAKDWALREILAGTHDKARTVTAKKGEGKATLYALDLPAHQTVDAPRRLPKVSWRMLPRTVGYIVITDLGSPDTVKEFDAALDKVRASRGLILDVRDIPRGGSTDVAEPIMSRLIDRRMGYQQVVPLAGLAYVKEVSPRGEWRYGGPVVVLVNRWTASMAEGIAIGLDEMKRATVVGTRMAGLNGGIFALELPNTKIGVAYPGERLNHVNGTPREDFVPSVLVEPKRRETGRFHDAILEAGYRELLRARDPT